MADNRYYSDNLTIGLNFTEFNTDYEIESTSTPELEIKETLSPVPESPVRKVGVLVSTDLGEFVNTLPALDALKLSYPGTQIVLLGQAWQKRFMEGRPGPVDRVEVVPNFYENNGPLNSEQASDLEAFLARMQEENFDIVLQMKDGGRCSNLFVTQFRPQLTAGLRVSGAPPLDRWIPFIYHQQQVLRNLEVVSLVGAEPVSLDPKIIVCEDDLQESYQVLPQSNLPVAVIYPGSSDPRCRWPLDKFAALGNALAWEGAQVVVVGNRSEKQLADSMISLMNTKAINLCGKLSLSGLAGLFHRAQVAAANDSGFLQFANACGAATVGVYWCGNLLASGPVTHSRHRIAISWQMNCPVCGLDSTRNDCGHKATYVAKVPKDEVIKSALEFIREYTNEKNGRNSLALISESPLILYGSHPQDSKVISYDRGERYNIQENGEGECPLREDPGIEPVYPSGW